MRFVVCFFLLFSMTSCAEYGTLSDGAISPGMSFAKVMQMYKTLGSAQDAAKGVPNVLAFKTADNRYLYFKNDVLISNIEFQSLLSEHLLNLQKKKEDVPSVVEENKSEVTEEIQEPEALPPVGEELRLEQEKYMREHGKFMQEQERRMAERDAIEAKKRQQLNELKAKKKIDEEKSSDLTLKDYYMSAMLINDCYEIRKGFRSPYIDYINYQNILRKMKLIEADYLKKDPKINKKTLWSDASVEYKNGLGQIAFVGRMMPQNFIPDVNGMCQLTSMAIISYQVKAEVDKPQVKNF